MDKSKEIPGLVRAHVEELGPAERSRILEQFLYVLKLNPVPHSIDSGHPSEPILSFGIDLNTGRDLQNTNDEFPNWNWGMAINFPDDGTVSELDGTPGLIDHCIGIEFTHWALDLEDNGTIKVPAFYCKRVLPGEWTVDLQPDAEVNAVSSEEVDHVLAVLIGS